MTTAANTLLSELTAFFNPSHVAVIGATKNNQWFGNIFANAVAAGYAGKLHPVNPGYDEIYEHKTFKSIADLPDGLIDFAIIAVRSDLVLENVKELKAKGITHVLIISSGFTEIGPRGKEMQDEIAAYCKEQGIIALGPNCLGYVNMAKKVSVFGGRGIDQKLQPGPVGVIGQSGATTELIVSSILQRTEGISLYITTGNELQLQVEDCLEYMVNEGSTRVIAAFIEEFRNIEKMKSVALQAMEKKIPLVVLKIGRSEKGKKAASSHTGALAGNDQVMEGFFKQYGIIRVETIEELIDTTSIFAWNELPRGSNVGICNVSGGLCGLYADLCDKYGIHLPPLADKTVEKLKKILPPFANIDNPLDVTAQGYLQGMTDILNALVEDDNLDVICPVAFAPTDENDVMAKLINNPSFPVIESSSKPLMPIVFKEINTYGRVYFKNMGVFYLERAGIGFKVMAHYFRYADFLRKRGYLE